MTGPEHYTTAEKHIQYATESEAGSEKQRFHLVIAGVHAQLATTAATALNDAGGGLGIPDYDAWHDVASLSRSRPDEETAT